MTHNLELRARAICEVDLRLGGLVPEVALRSAVDRYWHVVAEEIDAGLRDAEDRGVRHDGGRESAAYHALCRRH